MIARSGRQTRSSSDAWAPLVTDALTDPAGVIALLLAKGRARGPRAVARMGIALAIMLAPQPGVGVFVLVFSVGHIGTAAPVMLTWLVLDGYWPAGDAAYPAPRRLWFRPAVVGTLLAWALMADPFVLVIAVCPVLVVAGLRLVTGLPGDIQNGSVLRHSRHAFAGRWLEASLAAAAGLAATPREKSCGARPVGTDGAVTITAVTGCLHPYDLESKSAWYNPPGRTASFVLESSGTGYFSHWLVSPVALRQLGTLLSAASRATQDPAEGYTVHAYQGNLLAQLPLISHC